MKMLINKKTWLVSLILLLSACGFHLRGNYTLPTWFNQVYVNGLQNVNGDFGRLLSKRLQANNIQVVSNQAQAGAILNLVQDNLSRSTFATNARTGVASSYQIRYSLQYEVYPVVGGKKISGQFQQAENYEFDSNDLIGANERERVIEETLLNDAVNSIFAHMARQK